MGRSELNIAMPERIWTALTRKPGFQREHGSAPLAKQVKHVWHPYRPRGLGYLISESRTRSHGSAGHPDEGLRYG